MATSSPGRRTRMEAAEPGPRQCASGHHECKGLDRATVRTRTTSVGPIPLVPEHMVPLVKFLAQQDAASGVTGKCFDVMTWNIEHGYGGADKWEDQAAEAGVEEALQAAANR